MNVAIINTEEAGENDANLTKNEMSVLRFANGRKLDGKELAEVRTILRNKRGAWKWLGDLCEQIRLHAIERYRGNTAAHESIQTGLNQMRDELGFARASATERLVIEQILTCWAQCSVVGNRLEQVSAGPHSLSEGLYWERRYNGAQTRLVRSIEVLARLRKLELPTLQVNIGEKQVNVAGTPVR